MTVESLKAEFKTPAWSGLKDKKSVLYKFLTSDNFKNKNRIFKTNKQGPLIDKDLLVLFGLLHCEGTLEEKSYNFNTFLQECGIEKNGFIAASDEDFITIFD